MLLSCMNRIQTWITCGCPAALAGQAEKHQLGADPSAPSLRLPPQGKDAPWHCYWDVRQGKAVTALLEKTLSRPSPDPLRISWAAPQGNLHEEAGLPALFLTSSQRKQFSFSILPHVQQAPGEVPVRER